VKGNFRDSIQPSTRTIVWFELWTVDFGAKMYTRKLRSKSEWRKRRKMVKNDLRISTFYGKQYLRKKKKKKY
jgi:hypothetical protein